MSDQIGTAGKHVAEAAESAAAQVREQAEALRVSLANSEKLNAAAETAKKQADRVRKEAQVRGKAAAKVAAQEAKRARAVAAAQAPVVAAVAKEKSAHAIEVARERGGPALQDALLTAFDTEAGKKLAHTQPGAALKSKLKARKKRRRKLVLLLLVIPAAGGAAFKALQSRRSGAPASDPYGDAPVASSPGSSGTAAGNPVAGVSESSVASGEETKEQTEPPATSATDDGELHSS